MATILQKRLAREIVKDLKSKKPRNKKEILVSSGYSEISAEASARLIFDQKGVKEELRDLGFTQDGADSVVKEILYRGKKEENKLRAAEMVYKRLGSFKESEGQKTLILVVSSETAKRYAPDSITENSSE